MLASLFDYIKKEWAVLVNAPFTFVGLSILSLLVGFSGGMIYYSGQNGALREQINARDGEINRYRVALGIDVASKGSLIELSNQELRAKTETLVAKLRDLCHSYETRRLQIQERAASQKLNKQEKTLELENLTKEMNGRFVGTVRADTFNVDNELRRRLKPEAVAAIPQILPSLTEAAHGTQIDVMSLIPSDFFGIGIEMACSLADSIEQMANLLPPDSPGR
ncbi:MAG TPA: hypothetical protein VMT58_03880 [Candidatus Binataceae bacterium]|nr:hypothetical protein [Candidatus Binataceae bacterium]